MSQISIISTGHQGWFTANGSRHEARRPAWFADMPVLWDFGEQPEGKCRTYPFWFFCIWWDLKMILMTSGHGWCVCARIVASWHICWRCDGLLRIPQPRISLLHVHCHGEMRSIAWESDLTQFLDDGKVKLHAELIYSICIFMVLNADSYGGDSWVDRSSNCTGDEKCAGDSRKRSLQRTTTCSFHLRTD